MTVADCTGHGVPGAFMSMIGNTLLNEIIVEMGVEEPDKILNHLRDGIINALKQKGGEDEARDGMDIALMALDKENYTLEYAGAHNPLYHITQGRLTVLPADKQPVGYQKGVEKPFTKHTIKVQPGDVLYVFSDGYIDQFGGTEERKFKADRLRKILLNCWDEPMREQQKILESAFEQWKGDLEQVDDICVLGIRV